MKILHTADWHLGQSLYGYDRLAEQRQFLAQLRDVVADEQPDAMVVAGDIFDTSMPSVAAQRALADGLLAVHAAAPRMTVVVVAGNHDSASRLEVYRRLWLSQNVHVIGSLRRKDDGGADYDGHIVRVEGKGYIAAVPYVYPHNFPPSEGDRQKAFFRGLRQAVEDVDTDGLPTVLVAHLAVRGCDLTGHRRMQEDSLGTVDYVDLPSLGEGYDYVALGHIHHPQSLDGGSCCAAYSGSPLAVGFDERYEHSVSVVTLEKGRPAEVKRIAVHDTCPLVTIPRHPAPFDEAIAEAADFPSDRRAYIRLNVLLDTPLPSDCNERAAKAVADKVCRFCTINITDRRTCSRDNELPDVTPEQLRQMSVVDVAQRFLAAKGIDDELAQSYVKMISDIEKEVEVENAL